MIARSPLLVNVSFPQVTYGIARNMQTGGVSPFTEVSEFGGGDLNGTSAGILHGQAGTACSRIAVPRVLHGGGTMPNFCGVV